MADPAISEIDLERLAPQGDLRGPFEAIHRADWLDQGIRRWLTLLDPTGPWPVAVLGGRSDGGLAGTIVGVWAQQPVDRFDDLLETSCPQQWRGADRPAGGYWHFIAVTTDPQQRHLAMGRPLLGAALRWVQLQPGAQMRTLSPAVGLADALKALSLPGEIRPAARRIVQSLARRDGAGHLPILGLHPASGAKLEKVLWDSRSDEKRSSGVTLRFAYSLDDAERLAQQQVYRQWLARRAETIAQGQAIPAGLPERWWVPDCGDELVLADLANGPDGHL